MSAPARRYEQARQHVGRLLNLREHTRAFQHITEAETRADEDDVVDLRQRCGLEGPELRDEELVEDLVDHAQ